MAFKRGQSGNPAGKKPGTRNKATMAALELLEEDLQAITKVCADKAKNGDLQACKLILDKIILKPREQVVDLELPKIKEVTEIPKAQMAIIEAVAQGKVAPGEGQIITAMLESYRRSILTVDFLAKLTAVEQRVKKLEDKEKI